MRHKKSVNGQKYHYKLKSRPDVAKAVPAFTLTLNPPTPQPSLPQTSRHSIAQ